MKDMTVFYEAGAEVFSTFARIIEAPGKYITLATMEVPGEVDVTEAGQAFLDAAAAAKKPKVTRVRKAEPAAEE